MTKLNHSRPELKYKDGLSKMRRQFVAMAKDLAKEPNVKVIKGTTGSFVLDDEQFRTIMAMMDSMNDYIETFSRFAQGFEAKKDKKINKKAANLKKAEHAMTATIRIYIAMCIENGLRNDGKMNAGLNAFNAKLTEAFKDAPMLADVFQGELKYMEAHLSQKLKQTPALKA